MEKAELSLLIHRSRIRFNLVFNHTLSVSKKLITLVDSIITWSSPRMSALPSVLQVGHCVDTGI